MYALRPAIRFCRGIYQSSHCPPARQSLGSGFGPISLSAVQSRCRVRPRQHWTRPSTAVLAETSPQVLRYGCIHSAVVSLISLQSAADLSAAITAAPGHAALQSLAAQAAATPQQSWLAQEHKVQLLASLQQQEPASLAKVLLFYARLGPEHADLFYEAAPVLHNCLGQLTPQDLLRVLTACAAAAQHSPTAYSQELFAAAAAFLGDASGQLEPCGLADVAAAYAAVQHYDDDEDLFDAVVAAALQRLQSFSPEDLSRLCYALAELRFSAPELNTAALQQMAAQVESWPLRCIGRLVWALAAVQDSPDPCALDRIAGHVSVVLRNLRTSTDGQRVLASLGAQGTAAAAAAAKAASEAGSELGRAAALQSARAGPTWQGFGMTHSSSSGAGSTAISASPSTGIAASAGAASMWAASNSSMGGYEYVEAQDSPVGHDYTMAAEHASDGKVTTTYIKHSEAAAAAAAAGSQPGSRLSNPSPSSSSSSSAGTGSPSDSRASSPSSAPRPTSSRPALRGALILPPRSRALSSSSGSSSSGEGGSWVRQQQQQHRWLDERPLGSWQASLAVSGDCRPVYDDAESLQAALVNLSWAFAMLGHLHSSLAKECFRGLALVLPEAFAEEQLARLWGAQMRYQQLGHASMDPSPRLADSYSVFLREISRAAPRSISLPSHLQPLAAANWLLHTMRQAPEYEGQQRDQQQQQQQQQFSSCKLRDPAVLTQRGMESSVRQALLHLSLPVGEPCLTLDGAVRVGLPVKHNGVPVAWQVVPPAWCSRNPPYSPTVEAQMQKWALQYRGYTVLQVPFHEWASVLESGDVVVQAGYLQGMLDGVSLKTPSVTTVD